MNVVHHAQGCYLVDYKPSSYHITKVELVIDLDETHTQIHAKLHYNRVGNEQDIALNGENLHVTMIRVNDTEYPCSCYDKEKALLLLKKIPEEGIIETKVIINPKENRALEGLYMTHSVFTTQCEAEGFRHITFFLDRPDILSLYDVTIRAHKQYTHLLSNGNLVESGALDHERHYALWRDPHPKPCYLFALVAGDMACNEDHFISMTGKNIALRLYTQKEYQASTSFAIQALKKAMKWDEERFGLEYDLDVFNIVAISDFNMGAMENKGLNIFNAKYLVGDEGMSTDAELMAIESIIGHEYFHNYTGNRVTLRDWFQLSLKEGLTVFRDQEFTSDHYSRALKRLEDVSMLRLHQFPEDAGGLSHPVRPHFYQEINNFYTATVYEKGAEIIRMFHLILGEENFQKSFRDYIKNYDGQAVTIEHFITSLKPYSAYDLQKMMTWYEYMGTPTLRIIVKYDAKGGHIHYSQKNEKAENAIFPIPQLISFMDKTGKNISHEVKVDDVLQRENGYLMLCDQREGVFSFSSEIHDVKELTLSVNREFSAPIIVDFPRDIKDVCFLMQHDDDDFSSIEAGYQLAIKAINELVEEQKTDLAVTYIDSLKHRIHHPQTNHASKAQILYLPQYRDVISQSKTIKVHATCDAIEEIRGKIYQENKEYFHETYESLFLSQSHENFEEAIKYRQLLGQCFYYLTHPSNTSRIELIKNHYENAQNMTIKMQAMQASVSVAEIASVLLKDFFEQAKNNAIVMDKYFSLFVRQTHDTILEDIKDIYENASYFTIHNPNKTRALMGGFAMLNPRKFHQPASYDFFKNFYLQCDKINPQNAARQTVIFRDWHRHEEPMRTQQFQLLNTLLKHDISKDMKEMVTRILET